MSVKSVGSYSFPYALLRVYGWVIHRLWYRRIYIYGRENIAKGHPTILTPNHRNALMDALAVLFALSNQVAFIARADMFRNRMAAKALTFIKILPIYRPRDGRKEMISHNDESFREAMEVMQMGRPLVMFPEGDHGPKKRLRPLKKGVCRIAFQAEEYNDFKMGLKIVPVGIDYEHFRFRSVLTISFGKPIDVDSYADVYRSNQNIAVRQLQDDIRDGIRELMINISDEEHYHQILSLLSLYPRRLRKFKYASGVRDDQRIVELLENEKLNNPNRWQETLNLTDNIREESNKLKVMATTIPGKLNRLALPLYHFLLTILGFPLAVYGMINNVLSFIVIVRFRRLFKDPQFNATAKFAGGMFFIPFVYLIQVLVFQILVRHWGLTALYFISLPISLLFTFHYLSFLSKQGIMSLRMMLSARYYRKLQEINKLKQDLFGKLKEMEY